MGPVITPQSKSRVESLIATGEKQGAKILLDGRNPRIPKGEAGNFVKPTVLDAVPATSELTETEIFGPVLSLVHANDLDEALAFLERSPTAIRHRCSLQAERQRAVSAMKRRRATSASTSA